MTARLRTLRSLCRVVALLMGGAALAGCAAGAGLDRAGGEGLTLRLATIDSYPRDQSAGSLAGPATFVRELEKVSGGRIHVDLTTSYGAGRPGAEVRLLRAIARGEVDGGWPASRAFASAGMDGLAPLEAPLTLTNAAAVAALVSGSAARTAVSALDDSDVVGLALAAGGLRRPFADRPLTSPSAWSGVRFRTFGSTEQIATVQALGGVPVEGGASWTEDYGADRLDGVELDLTDYGVLEQAPRPGWVMLNVVLCPKVIVLTLNRERFESLSDTQRSWLHQAAARATRASVAPSGQGSVEALCHHGVHFDLASRAQLADLRRAVEPVLASLRATPATAELMREVTAIGRRHARTDVPRVPSGCTATSAGPERAPTEESTLPDGIYRVAIPVSAVEDAGVSNGQGWSGLWTLDVRRGSYTLTCRPLEVPGNDCGGENTDVALEAGHLRGTGHRVFFVSDLELLSRLAGCSADRTAADACDQTPVYDARWRVNGRELVFAGAPQGPYHLTLRPWTRIAAAG